MSGIVKNNCDWFPECSARQRRFPHPLCLLSAEPLYYAAVFIEGGGLDATLSLYAPYNGAFLNPAGAKWLGWRKTACFPSGFTFVYNYFTDASQVLFHMGPTARVHQYFLFIYESKQRGKKTSPHASE